MQIYSQLESNAQVKNLFTLFEDLETCVDIRCFAVGTIA